MRCVLTFFILISVNISFAQTITPIPDSLRSLYQFNLEKNFFREEKTYNKKFNELTSSLGQLNTFLNKPGKTSLQWITILKKYNDAEAAYRIIDLFLFLKYAQNTTDEVADKKGDSLRNIIRGTRVLLKDKIANLTPVERSKIGTASPELNYFITAITREKQHLLTAPENKLLADFQYLRSSGFYDRTIASLQFDKLITNEGEIDVARQMSAWQNHPDEKIRKEGESKLFKGYATQRETFGINYIHLIKGLNAFARTKHFNSIIEEKLFNFQLSKETLENMFAKIIEASNKRPADINAIESATASPVRFTITEATEILNKAFSVLGNEYNTEMSALLDPSNGRIDISGGENRIPIRGTASVYPIFPSIFYAYNYEGFLIDLTLLAHEAGHAIQASLMTNNKVPLMYATGPGYFTESFGKFNELLLFDYLSTHEKDPVKKLKYASELKERMNVLYGSTEEAWIEYSLINGIIENKIKNTDDIDQVTETAGSAISPLLYKEMPERKGLWMLLETNFREPLHNINDMIAAALAIKYFELYKTNSKFFIPAYLKLLKEGYHDSPANLLKKLNIDIQKPGFMDDVINFVIREAK